MKTFPQTLLIIFSITWSVTAFAQHRSRGNNPQPQPQNNNQQQGHPQTNNRQGHYGSQWNNGGSGVTVHIGNYPQYGGGQYYGGGYNYPPYGNAYPNGYNQYSQIRRNARNAIRQSAQVLGNALQFSDWNDLYSPWLAKAIRHQQYAKQLYAFGDYAGAINHSERAGFLAWNTLNYFNNGFSNNGFSNNGNNGSYGYPNAYPNPYSDPNNPYYRQGNPSVQTDNGITDDDTYAGYRKTSTNQPQAIDTSRIQKNSEPQPALAKLSKAEIDGSLPVSTLTDKDLLKTTLKDLDVE